VEQGMNRVNKRIGFNSDGEIVELSDDDGEEKVNYGRLKDCEINNIYDKLINL
jgi:hypothetical protein